jgi:hypothetical protein
MPLPKINLLRIAGDQFYLTDILSTATSTRVLNEILNHDAVFSDIASELLFMTIMTVFICYRGLVV